VRSRAAPACRGEHTCHSLSANRKFTVGMLTLSLLAWSSLRKRSRQHSATTLQPSGFAVLTPTQCNHHTTPTRFRMFLERGGKYSNGETLQSDSSRSKPSGVLRSKPTSLALVDASEAQSLALFSCLRSLVVLLALACAFLLGKQVAASVLVGSCKREERPQVPSSSD
jgi:hypothetical protein